MGAPRSLRDSGSSHSPAPMTRTMTGTLMRKTLPHQKCSRRIPPTSGPRAVPPEVPADQMAMAVVRWREPGKILRIRESVEGIMVAPLTPSRARAAMSAAALGAKAASMLDAPNPTVPMSRRRRRPILSATLPMVTSNPARVKE